MKLKIQKLARKQKQIAEGKRFQIDRSVRRTIKAMQKPSPTFSPIGMILDSYQGGDWE